MKILSLLLLMVATCGYCQTKQNENAMNSNTKVSCKLTTPELQERKRTVIAELKSLVLEKNETEKGAKYKFESSDKIIDLVTNFIKTERLCCDFFDFNLHLVAETGFMWLELSGPSGVKEFINEEIGF